VRVRMARGRRKGVLKVCGLLCLSFDLSVAGSIFGEDSS
jgi:hypothetical protein